MIDMECVFNATVITDYGGKEEQSVKTDHLMENLFVSKTNSEPEIAICIMNQKTVKFVNGPKEIQNTIIS